MKRLLPNGTVVRLEDDFKKKFMIIGRLVKNKDQDLQVWDYVGCELPMGIQTESNLKFFNHEQVKQLIFIGLQDQDELSYSFLLNQEYDKIKNK